MSAPSPAMRGKDSSAAASAARRPWQRAIIENVTPQVDCGRFAAKRSVGDTVVVEADAFTDGHDVLRCRLQVSARERGATGPRSR